MKEAFKVTLKRTDGTILHWTIVGTFKKAKECAKDYADSCHYESEWDIYGNGKKFHGSTIGRD